jgi:hypothetical protein
MGIGQLKRPLVLVTGWTAENRDCVGATVVASSRGDEGPDHGLGARCAIVWLMKNSGIEDIIPSKKPKTILDNRLPSLLVMESHIYHTPASKMLWVCAVAYVALWRAFV